MEPTTVRNPKAALINRTVQHLTKLLAHLEIAEQQLPGSHLAAQRQPLADLLLDLNKLRMPVALLPDGRLACGNCGNADRETLEIIEYVLRSWDLPDRADDENDEAGLVLDSGTDEVFWEGNNDGERLWCKACDTESIIPEHITLEWE